MHEPSDEHEAVEPREAELGFAPVTLVSRLFAGAPFAAGWAAAVVVPLVRIVESDVPMSMLAGALGVATIAPVVLYLRRHALDTSVRWDAETITLLRGGRVATSIAWRDAVLRQHVGRGGDRIVQIADAAGRRLTLVSGAVLGLSAPSGRARIAPRALDAILRVASEHGSVTREPPLPEARVSFGIAAWLLSCLTLALFADGPAIARAQIGAIAFAGACVALLVDPARRLVAAFRRPQGREILVIDTEERGRVRARRLDGSRVLLDVDAARHPDAMLSARRGFVNAVLVIPEDGSGTTYRSQETPIPATFVETRDDRVLRFERVRAALVDVVGYGAFFATAIAAALITS